MQLGYSPYQGSARQAYDAMVYGSGNSSMSQYLTQRADAGRQMYGHTNAFYAQMYQLVDEYNNSFAQEKLRTIAAEYAADTDIDMGVIFSYVDEDQIRNATVTMQQYIMCHPLYQQAYQEQRIDGYSDTYVECYPNEKPDEHPLYRHVMSGVTQLHLSEVEDNDYFYHEEHFDSMTDFKELSHFEKMSIMRTWDHAAAILAIGKSDPTDIYAGQL